MKSDVLESQRRVGVHARIAALLLFIGVFYAVDMLAGWSVVTRLWPTLVVLLGSGLIGIYIHRDRRGALFLASGIYLLCFSALAFYLNFTLWSQITRLWPLFIAFLGVSLLAVFFVSRRHRRVSMLAGLLLVSLAMVFFFVFSVDIRYWWIIFIFAGLSVLAAEKAG
jgi:hypothetical protein